MAPSGSGFPSSLAAVGGCAAESRPPCSRCSAGRCDAALACELVPQAEPSSYAVSNLVCPWHAVHELPAVPCCACLQALKAVPRMIMLNFMVRSGAVPCFFQSCCPMFTIAYVLIRGEALATVAAPLVGQMLESICACLRAPTVQIFSSAAGYAPPLHAQASAPPVCLCADACACAHGCVLKLVFLYVRRCTRWRRG